MKRSPLARSAPLRRSTPLHTGARARDPVANKHKRRFRRGARDQGRCMNPRCETPDAPWNPHHVIYKQHVRNHGGDQWDPRNAMRLCQDCHQTYHRMLNLPASILPPAALAFARDLLGENAADSSGDWFSCCSRRTSTVI